MTSNKYPVYLWLAVAFTILVYGMTNKKTKKDKDKYKDKAKDKDAEKVTESLTVCYIFGILMTQAFQEWLWIPPPGQPPQPP